MDHAKEAERVLDLTREYTARTTDTYAEAARITAVAANGYAEAQVRATLALAEQQRIANVLTFGKEFTAAGYMSSWLRDKHPDIARALGLDSEGDE